VKNAVMACGTTFCVSDRFVSGFDKFVTSQIFDDGDLSRLHSFIKDLEQMAHLPIEWVKIDWETETGRKGDNTTVIATGKSLPPYIGIITAGEVSKPRLKYACGMGEI